ncbi:polysaccharide deacetylase family protein [Sporomusa sp. KB1]|jgi:peptidoglycan/xylan/chitin deacetylase (PgdA/CDA1 family)|uniref:polysaccharide deacetylase family protein n=1 Tax=Sporomusa sp. KB1 TaxID=943346 RepID=UPI0011AB9B65|nr:polysaccharide deacetylase family protein [Sporomusa sp. KB1]TWH49116.1 peptidoglycan/xylan/chitin deacetylase (PgdA/CDA1 family) [Sporomusa sp. KB1]
MQHTSKFFQTVCALSVICLTLLVSSPLALLAFSDSASPIPVSGPPNDPEGPEDPDPDPELVPVPENKYTIPNNAIDAYYMNENPDNPAIPSKPVYDVFTVEERQARGLVLEVPKVSPYYGQKVVYLTFDDGPEPENTPAVLAILKSQGIKATFFVVGNQIEKYPAILRQIYQDGHAIGNHSYNHVYRELYQSTNNYFSQLRHTDEIIKNSIGVRPRISRAPGGSAGSFTKEYWATLKNLGYTEVGWNISSGDASSAKAGQLVNNIAAQMDNKNLWSHAILLMHDGRGHAETVKALPAIIKFYKDRQFEFRVVNFETPSPW